MGGWGDGGLMLVEEFGLVMAAVQHYDGRGSVAVEEKRTKAVQQAAAAAAAPHYFPADARAKWFSPAPRARSPWAAVPGG
jgi:hypothetical protein